MFFVISDYFRPTRLPLSPSLLQLSKVIFCLQPLHGTMLPRVGTRFSWRARPPARVETSRAQPQGPHVRLPRGLWCTARADSGCAAACPWVATHAAAQTGVPGAEPRFLCCTMRSTLLCLPWGCMERGRSTAQPILAVWPGLTRFFAHQALRVRQPCSLIPPSHPRSGETRV